MTIPYRIVIGTDLSDNERAKVEAIIEAIFADIDAVYNKWNPNSELSKLNLLGKGVKLSISPDLERFLLFVDEIVTLTEGRFDPTVETLQLVWKNALEQGVGPEHTAIAKAQYAIGWEKVHIENGVFSKDQTALTLDLGGVAKGFCVDRLIEELESAGYDNILVDWGGELKAIGQHPEGRPWRIFISNLGSANPDEAIAIIDLTNQAVATSGDYLQKWEVEIDGHPVVLCHILDPYTKKPLKVTNSSISSVTVMADNCALADGVATAAMLFPTVEEAFSWLESLKEQYPSLNYWIK